MSKSVNEVRLFFSFTGYVSVKPEDAKFSRGGQAPHEEDIDGHAYLALPQEERKSYGCTNLSQVVRDNVDNAIDVFYLVGGVTEVEVIVHHPDGQTQKLRGPLYKYQTPAAVEDDKGDNDGPAEC